MQRVFGEEAFCAIAEQDANEKAVINESVTCAVELSSEANALSICAEAAATNAKALANRALAENISTKVTANCAVTMAN